MSPRRLIAQLVAALLAPAAAVAGPAPAALTLEVDRAVAVHDARRVGVNLGSWTSWGAEQLSANVLKNPGFEGGIDRTIVVVRRASRDRFADDTPRLARPDGFWAGARFEVRTGPAAGQWGHIADSHRAGLDGLQEFITAGKAPSLRPGDVLVLTRLSDRELPAKWWIADALRERVTLEEPRPGSPGRRSVGLSPGPGVPVEIASYLDAIGPRAGKLLPITGHWRLSFWARQHGGDARLSVEFGRHGSSPFVRRQLTLGETWTKTTIEFTAQDAGPPGILGLRFRATGATGRVLVDDVELGRANDGPTRFRREVVDALRALAPGYLRDWQGQLADTLDNRVAEAFARRTTRSRPGDEEAIEFGYSLPDFLELCREVGADPWIIVPAAFSDEELEGLGRILAGTPGIDEFSEVLLEFGNENWNPLFRAGGILDAARHGEAAQRAFELVRRGAGPLARLRTVVNARQTDPAQAETVLAAAPAAEIVAVAPYFLYSLSADVTPDRRLSALFTGDGGALAGFSRRMTARGRDMAVYEVNLHTLGGNAGPAERDGVTAGAASGSALARTILEAFALGARRQAVWALAGYDMFTADRRGFVKLFGITRDLGATRRVRPTGLAVSMLNRALPGDLHALRATREAPGLTALAARGAAGWSAMLVNASSETRAVDLLFPAASRTPLPGRVFRLDAAQPEATNEDEEAVRVVESALPPGGARISVRLDPWSLTVMVPRERHR